MSASQPIAAFPAKAQMRIVADSGGGEQARRIIGDLIVNAVATLELAERLAILAGQDRLGLQIRDGSTLVRKIARTADEVPKGLLDAESLQLALGQPVSLDRFLGLSDSARSLFASRVRGRLPELGPTDIRLLLFLIEQAGRTVSHDTLRMIAKTRSLKSAVIKVYVSRIRNSLRALNADTQIETVRGGYRIETEAAQALLAAI